jgi:hypothetical protein
MTLDLDDDYWSRRTAVNFDSVFESREYYEAQLGVDVMLYVGLVTDYKPEFFAFPHRFQNNQHTIKISLPGDRRPISILTLTCCTIPYDEVKEVSAMLKWYSRVRPRMSFGFGRKLDRKAYYTLTLSGIARPLNHIAHEYPNTIDYNGGALTAQEIFEDLNELSWVTVEIPLHRRWRAYHYVLTDIVMGLNMPNMSTYVLIWIINWIPSMFLMEDIKKTRHIDRLHASIKRTLGRREYKTKLR